jgi:hypothetical protein
MWAKWPLVGAETMKYVCFDYVDYHLFLPIHHHRDEAAKHSDQHPTSAGFVRLTSDGVECYGESESLGIKSDPRDTRRLNAFLRGAA